MNSGKLIGLVVVAAAALAVALWLSEQRAPVQETEVGSALIPGLEAGLNDITQVSVRNATGGATLVRNEETWGIAERSGYAADVGKLREQLIKLARAKLLEPKTSNADNYSRLGVQDPMAEGAEGVLLTLDGLGDPIHLIVGDYTARAGDGTYMRFNDQKQSWLADANLSLDADPTAWLVKDVMNISSDRVATVGLIYPDGTGLTLSKSSEDDANYAVEGLPEGRELTSPSAPNSIANALSSIRLDDVRSASDFDMEEVAITETVFDTFDGLRISARSFEQSDKRYVAFGAAFVDELIPQDEPAADSGEEAVATDAADEASAAGDGDAAVAPPESRPDKVARAQAEALELEAKLGGWLFEIPSYKYTNLSKPLEELLKPLETDAEG